MANQKILVTGAGGQLGRELNRVSPHFSYDFIFLEKQALPIDEADSVNKFFREHQPSYCINCAAYTAVDKAESESEAAFRVNGHAAGILAEACRENNTRFVHISTDYVFDGNASSPYSETSPVSPQSVYGASKLEGERLIAKLYPSSIIIRTSWVYSEFGKNFVKTMLRLMGEKHEINVVNDQFGSPTYAADLAEAIMKIISQSATNDSAGEAGIFNYSNEGSISWYEFALAIKELSESKCRVNPISTLQYPTPAKRPAYSVLDKTKIQQTFGIEIKNWKQSLSRCLQRLSRIERT